jgi:hypothetical protein
MTDHEYARRLAELDRLLNDPDVPMDPSRVWALLADLSRHETPSTAAHEARVTTGAAPAGKAAVLPGPAAATHPASAG